MLLLTIGLLIFFSIHLIPTAPELHDGLQERLGASIYKITFSLLSLLGFLIIVLGYHKIQLNPGKNVVIWHSPEWSHYITWVLMLPAIIFLVAAYVPSRLRVVLKHPMLAGIKLWAVSHILVNGDLASLLLFGSFLIYAVYDRINITHRVNIRTANTEILPYYGDFIVLVLGVLIYFFFLLVGHQWLIGVPLL